MSEQVRAACVTCDRAVNGFSRHYRAFLLDWGTRLTFACLLLLFGAILQHPGGLFGDSEAEAQAPLYLVAALVGSSYIWWSAVQGIRERDFTADIPVSVATMAALAIGQYSAAAVVAGLLLVGGFWKNLFRHGQVKRWNRWRNCSQTKSSCGAAGKMSPCRWIRYTPAMSS